MMQKYKSVWVLIIILVAGMLLGACTSQPPAAEATATPAPLVLTDGLGKQFTLQTPYQRVVSLAPSNTEILFAIGAGNQVVARDAFSDFPEQATHVKDIGGGWGDVDTEAIIALNPDLVLAAEINAQEQVKALEDLGLNVFYLSNPKDLEGMYDNLRLVARLTGHEAETETLVESLK